MVFVNDFTGGISIRIPSPSSGRPPLYLDILVLPSSLRLLNGGETRLSISLGLVHLIFGRCGGGRVPLLHNRLKLGILVHLRLKLLQGLDIISLVHLLHPSFVRLISISFLALHLPLTRNVPAGYSPSHIIYSPNILI